MIHKINIFVVCRIILGFFFLGSGAEKIIEPYQNFLHVVQSYALFPVFVEEIVARVIPLIEVVLGAFLLSGFWLKWTLRAFLVLVASFICVVSQAMIRGLPIDECGCFGELISLPLYGIVILDGSIFLVLRYLLVKIKYTKQLSFDAYFEAK